MKHLSTTLLAGLMLLAIALVGCKKESPMEPQAMDPATAPRASVDRFSDAAGTLFMRSANSDLPGADEAITFDQAPFIATGLSPDGKIIQYYNFDVQPTDPAPIYVLFREGESTPVPNQLNIVDVIPGDAGYNDFWQVNKVAVPADYVANTITSKQAIDDAGYDIQETDMLVNCPIVPEGSTAMLRGGDEDNGLAMGWYEDQVVFYFTFQEKTLTANGSGEVPVSPIYVSFNINPGMDGGGPPSGFMTEEGSMQTHNVAATIPSDMNYSPLWSVNIYDNAEFASVQDLSTAQSATILASGAALVNCPVVSVGTYRPLDPQTAPMASIDRFSDMAGTLFKRSENANLPDADMSIDFDQAPFITKGLGPDGEMIQYYNFDVQSTTPAPIFVFFREGENTPADGQMNVVDVIPGDDGYNDFWHVHKVTVPMDYVANTITSKTKLDEAGYPVEETDILVNCPVVPDGSTAMLRGGQGEDNGLAMGWYKDQVIKYFSFQEKSLMPTGSGMVPTSPIYVAFNINPDEMGGGPASGFMTESGSDQTHNVTVTLPADMAYSPLWMVNVYDNGDFDSVMDLSTAQMANILATGVAMVNCPIVSVQ